MSHTDRTHRLQGVTKEQGTVRRREFLGLIGLGGLGLGLAACAPSTAPAPVPSVKPAPASSPVAVKPAPTSSPAATKPAVAVPTLAPTATVPKTMLPLKAIGISGNPSLINYEFARRKGFFQAQGVDPEISSTPAGMTVLQGVQAGEFDVGAAGPELLLAAYAKGGRFTIGGTCFDKISHGFYTRPGISSAEELRGKSLGIASLGSFIHMISVAWLKRKGIQPTEVEYVVIGANTQVFQAMLAGKVDGGVAGIELLPLARRQGVTVLTDNIAAELPNYISHVFYARSEALNDPAKREAMIRFVAGIAQGVRALYDPKNKGDYVKLAVELQQRDPDDIGFFYDWATKNGLWAAHVLTRPEQIDFVQELNIEFGQQTEKAPFEKVVDVNLQREIIQRIGDFKYPTH